ncbi:MAG: ABC transporter permease [Candidatus Eisenbacteria bacterium]|nr:ABC transporter permease [Candidatus Eisenbacteria bacterium]
MNARESAGIALGALRANKLRSLLTLLGVIIGVSSVIAVMSVVQGLDHYVSTQLVQAGSDVFNVDKVGLEFDFTKIAERSRRRDLTPDDAAAIARSAPHVQAAVAERDATAPVRRGARGLTGVTVRGVEPGYLEVNDLPLARGRPIGETDQRTRAAVCVIGSDVARELFGALDPIGRDVRLGGLTLTVVGVGTRRGASFGASQDAYALVALAVFERMYGRSASVTIGVRSRAPGVFQQAEDETRTLLRARRHVSPGAKDDFEIVTPEMYLSLWRNLSGAIFIVIVGVSLISLLVGGIVIMNIMLVSVTERTREIGIRKALGARRRDILMQFLIEAATLSAAGGVVGVALGVGAGVLIGLLTPLPMYVSPLSVGLGLGTATLVGLFFGAYPATRAARQDPIDALRYE